MTELIYLLLGLALVGFLVWMITTYIPMNEVFKNVIVVIAVTVMIVYVLQKFKIIERLF